MVSKSPEGNKVVPPKLPDLKIIETVSEIILWQKRNPSPVTKSLVRKNVTGLNLKKMLSMKFPLLKYPLRQTSSWD